MVFASIRIGFYEDVKRLYQRVTATGMFVRLFVLRFYGLINYLGHVEPVSPATAHPTGLAIIIYILILLTTLHVNLNACSSKESL